MSFKETIKVNEERVKKILAVQKEIEEKADVKIGVEGNDISITGESLDLLKVKNIVTAISRGFKPRDALLLLNDNYSLDLVEVNEFARTKNSMIRLKGRVIGDEGRAKRFIETHTGCVISVHGKTVSIIGENDQILRARKAVIMLLEGAKHGSVYHMLERVD